MSNELKPYRLLSGISGNVNRFRYFVKLYWRNIREGENFYKREISSVSTIDIAELKTPTYFSFVPDRFAGSLQDVMIVM